MNFPSAHSARYVTPGPNQPVTLHEGTVRFADESEAHASIGVTWLPTPKLRFAWESGWGGALGQLLAFSVNENQIEGRVTSEVVESHDGEVSVKTSGLVNRAEMGDGGHLAGLSFELPNFPEFRGGPAARPDGSLTRERMELRAVGWLVTIDSVPHASSLRSELKEVGGFGLTHTGWIERHKKAAFTAGQANELMKALHFFLSFVRGARTGPILPMAFDSEGRPVWRAWWCPRVAPWAERDGWFSHGDAGALSDLFQNFAARWANSRKRAPLKAAIHWYLETNRQSGGLEGSLILAQAALELLASISGHTSGGKASDRIRALLNWASVSAELPAQLGSLRQAAKDWGIEDGPHAITRIRNALTHAGGYQRLDGAPKLFMFEAWTLALWYVELALLRLFNYQGRYSNRLWISRGQWETESMPWLGATPKP